ncbi:GNAT family N-acetyltransferase [Streptomyces lonarensis]|uniref:GNAT family N-acetyltransferase n=1 Tax=Streptomyces lonarensis TaxID=700599 RepID=A0A7X6D1W9_9ACTN|nr:GNAT family N-acetyltransferase [Streptomyces lonarensis]NJQ06627.1 GNAT family N-acetyltransferase [Streptomyces lonarensis]
MNQHDLTLRPITGREELPLFTRFPYALNPEIAGDLDAGRRRPSWLWVAVRGDRPLARAGWWSRPGAAGPLVLDILDLDGALPPSERLAIGERLLRAATAAVVPTGERPPMYSRFVPADWREDPDARPVVEELGNVVRRTGGLPFVERLRLERGPAAPPPLTGRLAFREPRDPGELIDLMTDVLPGTLDAHSRDDLTRMSARQVAAAHYEEEIARFTTPRSWWRVATLPDGEPVGFVVPAHNGYNPIIAYLAVLPAHRGRGYIDDVLAEGTRVLAEQNVPRIRASTDLGNTPMADAFRRAGYREIEREITMTWQ